jgi:hypothetical protein
LPEVSAFQALTSAHLGQQRAFHHVLMAVEFADLLAFGHQGADAGARVEGRDAGTTGAQPFGQRALGCELQLQFTGQVLAFELLVLAHVAADHLLDLARVEQLAQAEPVDAGVVADDGEVLDAAVMQRVDQRFRNAAQAEAANGHQLAVLDDTVQRRSGTGIDLVHAGPLRG